MSAVLATILIISIIFILYGELRKWFVKRKIRNFESPRQLPMLGVAARFIGKPNEDIIDIVFDIFDEVKSTPIQVWLGPFLMIGISEPPDIETILTSDDCLNKPYFYEHAKCKTSLIATNREIWKPHRRALNTAFNLKMLQSYVPLLNHKSRILIEQMEPFLQEPGDIYRMIYIGMIDMVTKTTMGTEMNLQLNGRGAYLYNIAKLIMNNIQYRITRFWFRWDFMWNISKVGHDEKIPLKNGYGFIDELYEKRVNELQSLKLQGIDYLEEVKEKNATNFLDKCLILEQEGVFSHENVLDQMRLIVLAGMDTSAIAVFGTLLLLAMNQKHQDLVVEELRSIFDSADSDVTQDDLSRMQYLERVIKESLRLLSPTPFIVRKPSANIELAKGIIPRGAFVVINILHLHRNPKIWGENALEFDPDRFLPGNIAKRPPFSYIPFSGGARNCIALKYAMISAKITIAHLLRRYKFITNLKFEDIRVKAHLVLEVINEKPLRMEERNF
ncbi:probable cytochrome P450 313a4 [Contarinia nasturtii]|uniref:probable cytochrome P450 313a4 n=1 Tax=Contarinia nasturtii TaxID=265458 RepID=UPI0012D4006A|nr:probable cytochrome P450 313a4 [Contarinia nasturtii]